MIGRNATDSLLRDSPLGRTTVRLSETNCKGWVRKNDEERRNESARNLSASGAFRVPLQLIESSTIPSAC